MRDPLDDLDEAIAALARVDRHALPDHALLDRQERILRAQRCLDGISAQDLQVMDNRQATTVECGKSTRGWLVESQRLSQREAESKLRVARATVMRPAVLDAMTEGAISHKHAELIVNFLPRLDVDQRESAETELIAAARKVDPTMLGRGLRELTDRLCLDESAEERAVRQHEGRWLRITETFDGMKRLEAMLDPTSAAIVETALAPLGVRAGELDERHVGQRRADALVELARISMDSGQLPETAGEPTQVAVLTSIDDLTRRLKAGETCRSMLNDIPITPNTARMLACDAGIIPVVMGGASEVLDLGRSSRNWSRAQRKAAKIRAGGHCESPGCQAPIDRCDLHHEDYWEHLGRTDFAKAIYLCHYHHWLEHHTDWHFSRKKDGTVEIRRT